MIPVTPNDFNAPSGTDVSGSSERPAAREPLGVYVHIPFCVSKCRYCDFASGPARLSKRLAYVSALIKDIRRSPYAGASVDSIFFGGGTPSVVASDHLIEVLGAIRQTFRVSPDAEVTIECNPGDDRSDLWRKQSMDAFLRYLRDAGVNRLSIGVQSFDDTLLRALGRIHTSDNARRTFESARRAGFDNINLDLMFALPDQTETQWEATLREAIALAPEHISAYSLIVEEGTPYADLEAEGALPRPSEDAEAAMYTNAVAILQDAGYERYEVSAFARPGKRCRQNLHYWHYDEFLGFGASAASSVGSTRWTGITDSGTYTRLIESGQEAIGKRENLNASTRRSETMMMGLRLTEGVGRLRFATLHGVDPAVCYASEIVPLVENGLLEVTETAIQMTSRGFLLGNEVWEAFI